MAEKNKSKLTTTKSATFKKFLEAGKSGGRVLPHVDRHLLARPRDNDRPTNVLHPSEMVRDDWCHRASYFLLQGAEPAEEPASRRGLRTYVVFQTGHAIHDLWQSLFAKMGVLHGRWKCNQCGYLDSIISNSPACPLHGSETTWTYKEVPVRSKALRISGHADGILTGFGEPLLLEIKSMGEGTFLFEDPVAWAAADRNYAKAWSSLQSPFLKHILQAQLYMKLLEGENLAPQEAVILYHSKGNNEYKEFIIQKSDFGIAPLLEAAKRVVDAVEAGTPPSCNVGGASGCAKCKEY